ncbi:hypothetical protein [Limosilactobacillus equigenerosi]|uniref:hypothetical protein n=1 Tax=Limosilactobacillus equigenerosi TaxID=417373 RepID=UPI0006CF911B|nr:hypothetical protein [Limosilactobacillus equigenerosi]
MANFQVENLDAEYDQTQKIAYSAELTIYTSPLTSLTAFGQFAEYLTILIFELDGLGDYSKQYDRINLMRTSSGDYPHELITRLEGMRKYRNKSTHAELRKKNTQMKNWSN